MIFEDIRIGDVALVMPSATYIQDQYQVMNAPAVTVPFWGVSQIAGGAISITANTLILTGTAENCAVT